MKPKSMSSAEEGKLVEVFDIDIELKTNKNKIGFFTSFNFL